MARWNETVGLLSSPERYQDDEGIWHDGKQKPREVMCNRIRVGGSTWANAKAAGLKADARIQIRSCDYNGEAEVIFDGLEMDVEGVSDAGEFVTLTLGRKASND